MKKFGKVFIAVVVMSSMVATPVLAVPSSSQLTEEKKDKEKEVNKLQNKLETTLNKIEDMKADIKKKTKEVDDAGEELGEAEVREDEQYEAMKLRIRYIYEEATSNKSLEKILEAKNIVDMLNQASYIDDVYSYDREMLDQYIATKKEVQEKHHLFEEQLADLEDSEEELEGEQEELAGMISSKESEIADLDREIQEAIEREVEAARKAEEERRRQEELREQAEQDRLEQEAAQNNSNNNSSNNNSSNNNSSNNNSSNNNSNNNVSKPEAPKPEPSNPTGSTGQDVVNYAMQFIGNKYVYGGTSLTNGIDCSGFTQAIYRKFGYSIPRTSTSQRHAGVGVSYSNARPGDLICYSGHVAIYMGNGQIVHASNSKPYPKGGIKTGSATYRTILAVRRIIN